MMPDEHLEAANDLLDRQKTADSINLLSSHAQINSLESLSKLNRGMAKYRRSQAHLLAVVGRCLAFLTVAATVFVFVKWS